MKEINIAKTLVEKRKEKAITQDELAAYIGVSKASVSKWETGQSYPDITFLPLLAAYFNISIDELINYEPQMTKEDIKKLYYELTGEFSSKPFNEVMERCHKIIKKYYSCFPLLMQMAILFVNHYMLAKEKNEQEGILKEVVDLCRRIKAEEEDVYIVNEANSIEAFCCLVLQQPKEVLELLEGVMKPSPSDEPLLASAYHMTGDIPKAKGVLQVAIYQHLVKMTDIIVSYLSLYQDSPEKFEDILHRLSAITEAFSLDKLNTGVMLKIFLVAAQGYAVQNNPDKAIDMIERYVDICISDTSSFVLHGDKFFDSIDSWFTELDLGNQAPRNEKIIKRSVMQSITQNPLFTAISEQPKFKSIVDKMKTKLGGY